MPFMLVNGKKVPHDSLSISANDRGITLGHGLFETILVMKGAMPLLNLHWERLIKSCEMLDIKLPFTYQHFKRMLQDLIVTNRLESQGGIRFTITDGVAERGIVTNGLQKPTWFITAFSLSASTNASMTGSIVQTRRNENSLSSRVKSTSYLDNILAKKEAVLKGFDEGFLLNSKSLLAEGACSNIFVIKNNSVSTPFITDGALPGIIRHTLLHLLSCNTIQVKEEHITAEMLLNADEVFITNALMGIKPVSRIDNVYFNAHTMTATIANRLSVFLQNKIIPTNLPRELI